MIFLGIADRAAAGTSNNLETARLTRLTRRFAGRALEIIEGRAHTL